MFDAQTTPNGLWIALKKVPIDEGSGSAIDCLRAIWGQRGKGPFTIPLGLLHNSGGFFQNSTNIIG